MSQTDIWRGLECEVRADRSRAPYEQARKRHEALRAYPDLSTAVAAAAACRCEHRDAIVAALLAEHRDRPAAFWTAAAMLAMAPPLASLVRLLKNARGDRNDAKSIVLASFLEAVNNVTTSDRLSFRLFCETRRLIFHVHRTSVEDHGRRSSRSVAVCPGDDDGSIETRLDQVRFLRRAATIAPNPGERPSAYVERVAPSPTRRDQRRRGALLSNQRSASLADLREAFRSICQPQTDGETR